MAHTDWLDDSAPVAVACPAPMTRVALVALRNAGTLRTECPYTITDFVQGRFAAGTTITMKAVAVNELSMDATINSLFDNSGWQCIYDIDTNNLLQVTDNRQNVVSSDVVGRVASFDWGNVAYTQNNWEGAFTLTYGLTFVVTSSFLSRSATLNLSGRTGGIIVETSFDGAATVNLTNSNLSLQYSTVGDGGNLNATGYVAGGTGIVRSDIARQGSVTLGAGSGAVNITASTIANASTINHTGTGSFSFTNDRLTDGASITHSTAGAFGANGTEIFGNASYVNVTAGDGPVTLQGVRVGPYGRISRNNAAAINGASISYTTVDTVGLISLNGASTVSLLGNTLSNNSSITVEAGSTGSATINYNNLNSQASITKQAASAAGTMSVTGSMLGTGGFIQQGGTGPLTVASSTLLASGQITTTGVRGLNVQRAFCTNLGRMQSGATAGAGVVDYIQDSSCTDYALINFAATGAIANQVYHSSLHGLSGSISFIGTTTGYSASRFNVDNGIVTFNNNTVASPTMLELSIRDNGTLNMTGNTAAQDIRYCTVNSMGRWNHTNRTVSALTFGLDISANGTFTHSGAAGTAYYSSVQIGTINHNGGNIINASKIGGGTLTTGAFNHSGIFHHVNGSITLTAANTNRGNFQNPVLV